MSIIKTGVEVDTNSSFSNPTCFEENGVVSSINVTGLTAETGYYVRAYVVDDQGNRIDGENTYNFTTAVAEIDYFYIQNEYNGSNTITLTKNGSPTSGTTLEHSTNGIDWTLCTYDSSNNCDILLNNQGDKVYFRSSDGFSKNDWNFYNINCNHPIKAAGDLRTLLDYTDGNLNTARIACFRGLFVGNTNLINVDDLDFSQITTLANYCYQAMFYGCSSITTAPTLPATTLTNSCYREMFYGCSSLNRVVTYAQDISATDCLRVWLDSVSPTGDFYNLGGATYSSGTSGIPAGWTEHTSL